MANRRQKFANSVNILAQKRRNQLDMQEASEEVVPYAYCTIVMALKEMTDMSDDDVRAIIGRSQELWLNWEHGMENPLDACERVTGIRLANYRQAEAMGEV